MRAAMKEERRFQGGRTTCERRAGMREDLTFESPECLHGGIMQDKGGITRNQTGDIHGDLILSDLGLAKELGHSPKSFGLPHQDVGQGNEMLDLTSTPLTVHSSQDCETSLLGD